MTLKKAFHAVSFMGSWKENNDENFRVKFAFYNLRMRPHKLPRAELGHFFHEVRHVPSVTVNGSREGGATTQKSETRLRKNYPIGHPVYLWKVLVLSS